MELLPAEFQSPRSHWTEYFKHETIHTDFEHEDYCSTLLLKKTRSQRLVLLLTSDEASIIVEGSGHALQPLSPGSSGNSMEKGGLMGRCKGNQLKAQTNVDVSPSQSIRKQVHLNMQLMNVQSRGCSRLITKPRLYNKIQRYVN